MLVSRQLLIYTKDIEALGHQGLITRTAIIGSPEVGWGLLIEYKKQFHLLCSVGTTKLRVIKTHLSVFKLLKRFELSATLYEMDKSMKQAAQSLCAIFVMAHLDITPENFGDIDNKVIEIYLQVLPSDARSAFEADELMELIRDTVVDPSLKVAQLLGQIQILDIEDKVALQNLFNEFSQISETSSQYQSHVQSIDLVLSQANR